MSRGLEEITPAQREILEELNLNFRLNSYWIKKEYPQLQHLLEVENTGRFSIVVTPEGEINLEFDGKLVYPEDARTFSRKKVESFLIKPAIQASLPKKREHLYRKETNVRHIKFMERVFDIGDSLGLGVGDIIYADTKFLNTVIVLGVGLGYHIKELVDRGATNLIILEEFGEVIKKSMYTIRWFDIFKKLKQRNGSIVIVPMDMYGYDTVDIMQRMLIPHVSGTVNPALFHLVYIFRMFGSRELDKAVEAFFRDGYRSLFDGWGFIDDELRSAEQTYKNVEQKVPVLRTGKLKGLLKNTPVFIVGSGPSLNKSFEVIKSLKDRVIVVSCGTALAPLLEEGIVPDFHIEVERPYTTYEVLSKQISINPEVTKRTTLIALNPVHPEVFKLFKNRVMVIKPNDTGAVLTGLYNHRIYHVNPTVTNAALAVFLSLGFENVFLFGVDYGFVSAEEHHAKRTLYDKGELKPYINEESLVRVQGNRGDAVYTTKVWLWARTSAETAIREYRTKDAKVYNVVGCAYIDGTEVIEPEQVAEKIAEIGSYPNPKFVKDTLKSKFFIVNGNALEVYIKNVRQLINELEQLKSKLLAFVNVIERADSLNSLLAIINSAYVLVANNLYLRVLLRGTCMSMDYIFLSHLYTDQNAVGNMDLYKEFAKKLLQIKVDMIDEAITELRSLL